MTDISPGVNARLLRARGGATRLTPREVFAAMSCGAVVVDTRTDEQRSEQGDLPGVIVIDRTVLEWRLDPASPWRIEEATSYGLLVVVVCRQGYSSSLAAESLRGVGLHRATDMVGGVEAWMHEGLPAWSGPVDVRK